MVELEPDVDIYGTYARASAFADFVELRTLQGLRWARSEIADYIGDLSWGAKLHETFSVPSSVIDEDDEGGEGLGVDAESAAERVLSQLADREAYLKETYPFHLDPKLGRLELLDGKPSPYLALLAITTAHAFNIDVGRNPREVFEDTVSQALTSAGHTSINFSRLRRSHSNFSEALTAAGPALALSPIPSAASISLSAQDAGADVIAHVHAGYLAEGGIGAWTLVGQVTCGRSDTWQKKLVEVEVPAWRSRLGAVLPPLAFLAIPHHAERSHLHKLVTNEEKMVLDRLRLTKMLKSVSRDEQAILDVILSTPTASQ